ncbi:hypothetical protein CDAR_12041 [Caerostris darwini]|uniref:Uncharacterized protein n=1 Tax=Caerostris darwini TaxID=1538125 RepID=A0AAV4M3R9_9ARAC|nr:hypothetical protein CDAR_12041 [Caerostris darwini]
MALSKMDEIFLTKNNKSTLSGDNKNGILVAEHPFQQLPEFNLFHGHGCTICDGRFLWGEGDEYVEGEARIKNQGFTTHIVGVGVEISKPSLFQVHLAQWVSPPLVYKHWFPSNQLHPGMGKNSKLNTEPTESIQPHSGSELVRWRQRSKGSGVRVIHFQPPVPSLGPFRPLEKDAGRWERSVNSFGSSCYVLMISDLAWLGGGGVEKKSLEEFRADMRPLGSNHARPLKEVRAT